MGDIVLSAGVRQNLLSLQNTAQLMATTQNRLATGKKVNSALDNPTNFFTSASLQTRAGDLNALLDSMSNGIKTLEAADNALTSITKTLETMQSTLRQARQDKSFPTASYALNLPTPPLGTEELTLEDGAIGATPVAIALTTTGPAVTPGSSTSGTVPATYTGGTLTINGINVTIANDANSAAIKSAIDGAGITGVTVTDNGTTVTITNASDDVDLTGSTPALLASLGLATSSNYVAGPTVAKTVDQLVSEINQNTALTDKIVASNDSGKLRIQNLSTQPLTVTGITNGAATGGTSTTSIGGNDTRTNLAQQFNTQRDQLDKFSDDAYFNGVNLLRGDKLKLVFNENGSSSLDIQARDKDGNPVSINNAYLQIPSLLPADLDSDAAIDEQLATLGKALEAIRSQASNFGSNLSIVQNRQDFTKKMINTLQTGADNLVLADSNEEGANLLALQTRQQLSTTALSLSAQADQAVLRLFG
ncbi:MAG TPA: flagellin [Pseudolabrys sp.]|nr:flagellin [Pseudolabrys sp.]